MKKISICVACYNEESNVYNMYAALTKEMQNFKEYDYEIIFGDNDSQDSTRQILRDIAMDDKRVKVVFNARNFGPHRSGLNILFRATGDAIISLPCDFQTPPEMVTEAIRLWEQGGIVVCGQKEKTEESKLKHFFRSMYYKIIKMCSEVPQYEHLVGMTLMDRKILQIYKECYEPGMDFRHVIAELGYKIDIIPYRQQQRAGGKSSYNLLRYFDFAITSLVHTSFAPMRLATIVGVISSFMSFAIGCIYFVYKLINWNSFDVGIAPLVIGIFFIGSIQLLFLGLIGEYIGAIIRKMSKMPLVAEEEVINFEKE